LTRQPGRSPTRPPQIARPVGEAFDRLKRQVIARTGHFYYQDKDDVLWERVRRRVAAVGASSLEAYLGRLDDAQQGAGEWAALESELTIGETYFFRYREQFQALRTTILPAILKAARETRRLRIWSAGCATGAEPYSLAILLREMLGEAFDSWSISILGTDINEAFLAAARDARFSHWALRSLSAEQCDAWFHREGERWVVRPEHRSRVRFQRGNLLDLLGPAPPLELVDFDLILCRNVLIYFHPQQVAEVAGALVRRLRPHGWLLVGHAEPNPEFGRFADAVSLPGTVAYRPPGTVEPNAPRPEPWAPLPEPAAELIIPPPLALKPSVLSPPRPPPASPAPISAESPPAADLADEVRRRADVGDFAGAELACRAALRIRPDDPTLHFYAGLVEQALGRPAAAEDALRRAVYLDRDFVLALYHLGLVRLARGRREEGRKAIAAAAQISGTLAADMRLREGAGLTAGDLRELARVQLETHAGAT
jgi:chemotaxis protein methyltransferase CheR